MLPESEGGYGIFLKGPSPVLLVPELLLLSSGSPDDWGHWRNIFGELPAWQTPAPEELEWSSASGRVLESDHPVPL